MIKIVEQDGNDFELCGQLQHGEITILTEMTYKGCMLILDKVHIGGPGRGSSSRSELLSLVRELGQQHNVDEVIIYGGKRSSGAKPGKKPIPIIQKVWRVIIKMY